MQVATSPRVSAVPPPAAWRAGVPCCRAMPVRVLWTAGCAADQGCSARAAGRGRTCGDSRGSPRLEQRRQRLRRALLEPVRQIAAAPANTREAGGPRVSEGRQEAAWPPMSRVLGGRPKGHFPPTEARKPAFQRIRQPAIRTAVPVAAEWVGRAPSGPRSRSAGARLCSGHGRSQCSAVAERSRGVLRFRSVCWISTSSRRTVSRTVSIC
jgi:hypothetical protein